MTQQDKILAWLDANPGWRYGLEIAKATKTWRSSIYVHLSELEGEDLIESRIDPQCQFGRHQYRLKPGGRRIFDEPGLAMSREGDHA